MESAALFFVWKYQHERVSKNSQALAQWFTENGNDSVLNGKQTTFTL